MELSGIFDRKDGGYYWLDCMGEWEIAEAKYFVDEHNCAGYHKVVKSALYDDMDGYVDTLQHEEDLADGELYVVTYFEFEECSFGLMQEVDFGITKQEIIENVNAQKYVEGASYHTMGQMFYTTRMMMEERQGGAK